MSENDPIWTISARSQTRRSISTYENVEFQSDFHLLSWWHIICFNKHSKDKKDEGGIEMKLNTAVKKNWIEIQKKYDVPVNAIGIRIDSKDEKTMKVWQEEGIDGFVKK